ncbi:amidophosphoribosyltransferase isoform X2 [Heterocephalus glaber]|uniref:Amidophosphoribosyltransferase n=1 Tax=Heterocephalus glaber TaxID=10181 RepID=A0AAX6PE30_HETGA|nr:amidophosphoribosyltransferase isoform X2 [Heterocephalus glaber]
MELEESGFREACGVFGCIASGEWPTQLDVPYVINLGLVGLQHRGQESAGIVTSDGSSVPAFKMHKGMGLVNHVFTEDNLKKLYVSNLGIGHTRYATTGRCELENCQPFVVETLHGKIAVAHNGELVNAPRLRKKLLRHGIGLSTSSDSEMITQLLAYTPPQEQDDTPDWVARIKNLMKEAPTAYSLLIMYRDVIYAVRDPYGIRPLCIGRLIPGSDINDKEKKTSETEGWVVSSESCSFLSIGAIYYREILPGEIVEISRHGVQILDTVSRSEGNPVAFCIFEYVYFARPDSMFEDQMVYTVRYRCGQQLAIEAPVDADLVSTVPESATPAALGYAKKVHIRVASPPVRYPCFMGINIPTKEELIANKPEFGHLAEYLGASSVVYLSVEGLVSSVQEEIILKKQKVKRNDIMIQQNGNGLECFENNGHCTACLTGKYPVELEW